MCIRDSYKAVTVATWLHSAIADDLAKNAYVVLPTHISKAIPSWMKKDVYKRQNLPKDSLLHLSNLGLAAGEMIEVVTCLLYTSRLGELFQPRLKE